MTNKENIIELLSPVGSFESLIAAVQNGCNAVYLGGKSFSARASAANFDDDELKRAVEYAHLRNVNVYVTVNTILDSNEVNEALKYISYLYDIDVDGIIIQDLGLAKAIHEVFPDFPLHGSTQMTINNLDGAKLLEKIGFTRAVLARETPIEEIEKITGNTKLEIEVFAHGALCVSFSGQCLMSSMIGGRSGNRGRCAQPCRKAYDIVGSNGEVVKNTDTKYYLSPRDLNTLDNINRLIDVGVHSLKIEGRMKRPEYVATVTSAYRSAIDKNLSSKQREDVEQIFNRGFTQGLTFGEFGKDYINTERPNNRGIVLGKVLRSGKNKVIIKLNDVLNVGDGVEIQIADGSNRGFVSEINAKIGDTVEFYLEEKAVIDSVVRKTSDIRLNEKARNSFSHENKFIELDLFGEFKLGSYGKLVGIANGVSVEKTTDQIIEQSKNAPMTREKIVDQISKLGGTNYRINSLEINVDDNIFLPVSIINLLRRQIIEELDKHFVEHENRSKGKLKDVNEYIKNKKTNIRNNKSMLSIEVNSHNQFQQLDLGKVDRIYFSYLENVLEDISKADNKNIEVFFKPDRIMYSSDYESLDRVLSKMNSIKKINANNLGTINRYIDNYEIHAEDGINVFNYKAVENLEKIGVNSYSFSPELTFTQIADIVSLSTDKLLSEAVGYGFTTVMTMKYCPMSALKGCLDDSKCSTCEYRKDYYLRDAKGIDFMLRRNNSQTLIYNAYPICMIENIEDFSKNGVNYLKLVFTRDDEPINEIQKTFYDGISGLASRDEIYELKDLLKSKYTNITKGHYYRGIE